MDPRAEAGWVLPPCLLCGGTSGRPALDRVAARPIWTCPCGLTWAARREVEDAAAAYGEAYFRGLVYADYLADREAIRLNAARHLAGLEREVAGRRLLDAGCAAGFFLEAARDRGWAVQGIELSEFARGHARRVLGLDVWAGSIEDPPADLPVADVVTLWDVIEHLGDPRRALAQVLARLAPGGRLVVSTGDHGSLLRRVTGRRWRLFSDATHLYFFDVRSLTRLLERTGFRVLRVRHHGKRVGLGMVLQQSGLPGGRALARLVARLPRQPWVYANLWDVMTVTAAPADGPAPGD